MLKSKTGSQIEYNGFAQREAKEVERGHQKRRPLQPKSMPGASSRLDERGAQSEHPNHGPTTVILTAKYLMKQRASHAFRSFSKHIEHRDSSPIPCGIFKAVSSHCRSRLVHLIAFLLPVLSSVTGPLSWLNLPNLRRSCSPSWFQRSDQIMCK